MNCFKYPLVIFTVLINSMSHASVDLRSDTLDILHYRIHLDITNISPGYIKGFTVIKCNPKINGVQNINLDLLKMNVDSVQLGSNNLLFSYNDTLLQVQLGSAFVSSDTFEVYVYYQGRPVKDLSNWGGFYFQSGHAFNMGVGFAADPHNFGRVWFPCFDNFVERSSYTFEITTSGGRKAYCNGSLVNETVISGDTLMRTWQMNEEIPTYLAAVAIGPYSEVNWMYQGIQSQIPVQIAVRAVDSTNLKNSFIHLNDAMDAYEAAYGPYLFNKVGYSIVPFNSGAMEHASMVAYPSNAVNGNTGSELLMAHELSHHWWGNLVTCDDQEDMWLNEGWASFSEHLFLEHVYGRKAYIEEVMANHINVIQYAHFKEEEYRAVSGLPHQYTYGTHVYDKGATIAHNLRAYLGDSLFFGGIKQFMHDFKFNHISSELLRDELEIFSGKDLSDFFADWVFGAGFTNIAIDSFKVTPSAGQNRVDLFLKQKKRGSDHFFTNVPVTVRFLNKDLVEEYKSISFSGEFQAFQFDLPIEPVMLSLNTDNKLAIAVTADEGFVEKDKVYDFRNGKMKIEVTNTGTKDSVFLRIEHHWAEPDAIKNVDLQHIISNYRYWKVDGILPIDFEASATLEFDGRNTLSGGGGHLDDDLLANGNDSIILLYRTGPQSDWWEYQHYSKVAFSGVPFGRVELDKLLPGEYTFANGYSAIGVPEIEQYKGRYMLSPNPVTSELNILDLSGDTSLKQVFIFSTDGRLLMEIDMNRKLTLDISSLKNGNYLVNVIKDRTAVYSGKFIVSK